MRIIITIEGGLVDWVQTDAKEPIEVMVRDLDTEGVDPNEITKGIEDGLCDACVSLETQDPNDPEQEQEFNKIWNHFKPKD